MRTMARSLLKTLEWLPGIGQSLRVVNLMHTIRRLEEERNWEDARGLRSAALQQATASRSAPLWRSEGEDLLYNRRNPAAALAAFQSAEKALNLSPALYGVAAPDRIYAGAAQAALAMGKIETGRAYFQKFSDVTAELSQQRVDPAALAWHQEMLAKLKRQLSHAS